MRHLLLLLAMVAAGQHPTFEISDGCAWWRHSSGIERSALLDDVYNGCPSWRQWRHEYRIDWLRPAIPEAVIAIDDYGRPVLVVGSGFYEIIGSAPEGLLTIYLPNGKRVKITRAELEGRAK